MLRNISSLLFLALCFSWSMQAQTEVPNLRMMDLGIGLIQPVDITYVRGDSNRLFILEKAGRVRIYDLVNQELLAEPLLDISDRVRDSGERGCLGLVFHPDYLNNGRFFINYTTRTRLGYDNGTTLITEYVNPNPLADTMSANNEGILLAINQPFSNHNGGSLAISPLDGYLYIGTGDGGGGGDPEDTAQNPGSLLGKILRIDIDFVGGSIYGIPPDNPYAASGDTLPEIWAMGIRNPWRMSFDRDNGDFYIGDVGQNAREEIDFQAAGTPGGLDYGWDCREGFINYSGPSSDSCQAGDIYTDPIVDMTHTNSGGFSITGGYVYRGDSFPAIEGWYICADFVLSNWFLIKRDANGDWESFLQEVPEINSVSCFGEDAAGNLYAASLGGRIYEVGADPLSSINQPMTGDPSLLNVFPNPSEGDLNIRLQSAEAGPVNAQLFDLAGRLLSERNWDFGVADFQSAWSLGELPAGTYQLRLTRNGQSWQQSIVIK
ncbi:MAG: PQQ-dependent sugar dehydrogenase [Bacteroidota bacterium]